MTNFVDGELPSTRTYEAVLDDFVALKRTLNFVKNNLHKLSQCSTLQCKLCSVLQKDVVCHGTSGCPREFNICYKCFGQHKGSACSGSLFKVPEGDYCYGCWMPLFPIFGIQLHPRGKEFVGSKCKEGAYRFVKPMSGYFFYNRKIAGITCPTNMMQYQEWLFHQSHTSVSGGGHVPNIIRLLESVFCKYM